MDKEKVHLRKIILTGLMITLVFIATSIIKIPTTNGYIHLGDGFVFISAYLLGPFYGAIAAGVGSMLADLLSPYAQWALPTFIIKSLMALIMGLIIRQKNKKQTSITVSAILIVWVGFFTAIKSALQKAVNTALDNLAGALEDSPGNVQKLAGNVQTTLTIAIILFIVLVLALVYRINKKQKYSSLGPGIILGMISAGTCMIIGYFITEIILYGNPISPAFSVPMNIIQFIMGIFIFLAVTPGLKKAYTFIYGESQDAN
ncbi:MAG: ECF transporter S component [Clostridiaceae bacterium]|jgi:uncharacterized membrane protein|nr:ECF transporter S component [Clostridiaceae bacterium]